MLCRWTTSGYNKLFVELLARLHQARDPVDDVLVGYLAEQESDGRIWPGDREFTTAFTELPLYRLLTRGRLRMVLEAIEELLRDDKVEIRHVTAGTLTVEHVMPQSWKKHWPAPASEEARAERERLLHGIGNLTLLTVKLNAAQSNACWTVKLAALGASVLYLTRGS